MEKVWKIKNQPEVIDKKLSEKYHPVILNLLAGRGILQESDIEKFFSFDYEKDLQDPLEIKEIEKTIERISEAKNKKEKIAIFGDYDADGVTASALLYEALSGLGFSDLVCYIPDRQGEGYGMNEKAVGYLKDQKVKLIITVDCGITNVAEAEKVKELGMELIITDHHAVPEILPKALAVINPNIFDSGFRFNDLAGVGVAFKLAQALYEKMAPEKKESLKWLLDLVAVGTIADCSELLGENRILAKYGLIVLSKTRRTGFQEIFKVGRIAISENQIPDTHKVAYQIAPRINAAGRMDHANAALNLIIEKNPVQARTLALEVEGKNQERQKITGEIFREVSALAESIFKERKFIWAANPHWPVGILGLVAGKITEEFQKPTAVFQKQESEYIGSLRSIPELDIYSVLKKCAPLLRKFGGHPQAAGVTVSAEKMDEFCRRMTEYIEKDLAGVSTDPILEIDCEISGEEISWDLVSALKKMEPFGEGNETPVFLSRRMIVVDSRIVGNGSKHLKLSLHAENGGPKIFDAIGFSLAQNFPDLKKDDKIDIVYNLEEDEWNGNKKIQLKLIDLKKSE